MDSFINREVTHLLDQLNDGKSDAWEKLLPVVYQELRVLAASKMAKERPGQTLQPTALVNEAYLRLVSTNRQPTWENRRHFFAAASEAMRRILVDAARKRMAQKRGGGRRQTLAVEEVASPEASEDLLALHEALDKLASDRPEIAELVKLRYFAGFTNHQSAECLGVAPRTADNYWAYAKAYLLKEIEGLSGKGL